MQIFGVHVLGLNDTTLHKLLLSAGVIVAAIFIRSATLGVLRLVGRTSRNTRSFFLTRQLSKLLLLLLVIVVLVSIWFDNPGRLATAAGLISAGLAIALQRVVTSFAGYILIVRGNLFSTGDRITIGGVRGDVVSLGFIQTRVMEMGQPPDVGAQEPPGIWVRSRQFTGRIATISNDRVFDSPVYNYTREFPFLWEEIHLPISYESDREKAEKILLDAAEHATKDIREESERQLRELEHEYQIPAGDIHPKVFYRLTDNWLELTLRFVVRTHGVRDVKDQMSRHILQELEKAGISIASATYDVVGFPPIKFEQSTLNAL